MLQHFFDILRYFSVNILQNVVIILGPIFFTNIFKSIFSGVGASHGGRTSLRAGGGGTTIRGAGHGEATCTSSSSRAPGGHNGLAGGGEGGWRGSGKAGYGGRRRGEASHDARRWGGDGACRMWKEGWMLGLILLG